MNRTSLPGRSPRGTRGGRPRAASETTGGMAVSAFGRKDRRGAGEGRSAREVFDLALLEQRLLYCVDHGLDGGLSDHIGSFPAVYGPVLAASTTTTGSGATSGSVL